MSIYFELLFIYKHSDCSHDQLIRIHIHINCVWLIIYKTIFDEIL